MSILVLIFINQNRKIARFIIKRGGNENPIYAKIPNFAGGINTTPIEPSISKADDIVITIPKMFKSRLNFKNLDLKPFACFK